jgi:hypothetical protein
MPPITKLFSPTTKQKMQSLACTRGTLHFDVAERTGFEPLQDSSGKSPVSESSGAKLSAVGAPNPILDTDSKRVDDPDLLRLIEAWPKLNQRTKKAVLKLVGNG